MKKGSTTEVRPKRAEGKALYCVADWWARAEMNGKRVQVSSREREGNRLEMIVDNQFKKDMRIQWEVEYEMQKNKDMRTQWGEEYEKQKNKKIREE